MTVVAPPAVVSAPVPDAVLARIRPDVRAMHAYHVQLAAGMVKLDAMENPFPLPQPLQQALGARLGALALNRYPGERTQLLQERLRLIMFELAIDLVIDLVAHDDRYLVVGTEVDQHITQAFPFRHIAIGHGQPVKLLRQQGTRPHHHPHAEP